MSPLIYLQQFNPFAFALAFTSHFLLLHLFFFLMDRAPPQAGEQPHNHSTSAAASSSSAAMPSSTSSGHMSKHRMSAAISLLNQQIQTIQDELDELETIGGVSTVCPDLIASVESIPDALLPVTSGPVDVSWERWFQGAQSSRSRRRWI